MKSIYLLLLCLLCTICKAQTVGSGISVGHVTLSSGVEVTASCNMNDNVLEVQVEGNTEFLEVLVVRDGEVKDYDITYQTNDTMSFNIEQKGNYVIYLRTEDDSNEIMMFDKKNSQQ